MPTYTFNGFSINGDSLAFFGPTSVTITLPENYVFRYAYSNNSNNPGFAFIDVADSGVLVPELFFDDTNSPASLSPYGNSDNDEGYFFNMSLSTGNVLTILLIYDASADRDHIFVVDSTAPFSLPRNQSEFNGFLSQVTSVGLVSTGPFAPGVNLDFDLVVAPTLASTSDDDTWAGFDDAESFDGGAGNDNLDGGGGNDTLLGGLGNDTLIDGLGDDSVFGGAGDDLIYNTRGNDTYDGGDGYDTIFADLRDRLPNAFILEINFTNGYMGQLGNPNLSDTITNFEAVEILGPISVTATGDEENNLFLTGSGNDTLDGGLGNDTLNGGAGNDRLIGGSGDDSLDGGVNADTLVGNGGNDTLSGGFGFDQLFGGFGNDDLYGGGDNDTLYGFEGFDRLFGEQGDDLLYGEGGNDAIFGGFGNDRMFGGNGNDFLAGFFGDDTIFGEQGNDVINAGDGNDRVLGGTGDDQVFGGNGNDLVFGWIGNDRMFGQFGNDTIFGEGGNDLLDGGGGDDVLNGGVGQDRLFGWGGNDLMTGGADADVFIFANANGSDTITDFQTGVVGEVIDLARVSSITNMAQLNAAAVDTANGVLITLSPNNTILLQGLTESQLSADDFIFT